VGVEGGSGLLDSILWVPLDNVHLGVDSRHVLSDQRLHVVLSKLVLVDEHVGNLVFDVLEGGVSSVLLFHLGLLSPCSLSKHLHGDLLRLGVVVLDDDDAGVEYRRRQSSASERRAPRNCPLQPPRQACS
jgi:hypothetical protein